MFQADTASRPTAGTSCTRRWRSIRANTRPKPTDSKDQHIYMLAADGSSETEIVKTAGHQSISALDTRWKAHSVHQRRSGKFDLWSVAVQNGKAVGGRFAGPARCRKRMMRRTPRAVLTTIGPAKQETEYVNIVEFAPGASGKESRIARATESFVGIGPTWSPDGKSIAVQETPSRERRCSRSGGPLARDRRREDLSHEPRYHGGRCPGLVSRRQKYYDGI